MLLILTLVGGGAGQWMLDGWIGILDTPMGLLPLPHQNGPFLLSFREKMKTVLLNQVLGLQFRLVACYSFYLVFLIPNFMWKPIILYIFIPGVCAWGDT